MKVGIVGTFAEGFYEKAEALGADYFEITFVELATASEEENEKRIKLVQEIGFPIPCACCLLDSSMKIVGEDRVSKETLQKYLEHGFKAASRIGIQYVVMGSGGARTVPEGFDRAEAMLQLMEAAEIVGDVAAKYGCTIVFEPMTHFETNLINTVEQGAEFVRRLKHPQVRLLADCYHMRGECEDMRILGSTADLIDHTHISESIPGSDAVRYYPNFKDAYHCEEFIQELKKAGYTGRVSIEAKSRSGDPLKELAESVKAVKQWILN